MNTTQLEFFLTVARMESMTTAAMALNTSQSSVSRSITRLEEELGVPLFERQGRGMILNDYGKNYFVCAETVLRELNDGERRLKDLRDAHLGRVSFSSCTPRALNSLMVEYFTEHPDILIRHRRLSDINMIKTYLDSGLLDYALTYSPLGGDEYEWQPLLIESYYAMVPPDHHLACQDTVHLSELAGEPLLINAYNDPDFIADQFRFVNVEPHFAFISEEHELMGPMVESGLGLSFISTLSLYEMKSSMPMERLARTQVIPIEDNSMHRTIGLLQRKHHYMSDAARTFYRKLLSYFKNIEMAAADEV